MAKLPVKIDLEIDGHDLGGIAADLKGEDAQNFWFNFVDRVIDINEYALNISTGLGGKRKDIFKKIYHHMMHHEAMETKD